MAHLHTERKPQAAPITLPLTDRERLERDAAAIYALRQREAEHGYRAYAVCAYDRARDVAYVRYDTLLNDNPIYQVHLTTDACDCPDARARIAVFNRRLAALGLPPTLTCKHPLIVARKRTDDPALLDRVPHPADLPPELRRAIVTTDGYARRPDAFDQLTHSLIAALEADIARATHSGDAATLSIARVRAIGRAELARFRAGRSE